MNSYLLDSSFLIGLFWDRDFFHERAKEIFTALLAENINIFITERVIEETATVLTYKGSKIFGNQFLDYIFSTDDIKILSDNFLNEIQFFHKEIKIKISFIDASLLYQTKKYKCTLISFDEQLLKLAQKL